MFYLCLLYMCVCNYIYFQIGTSNIFTWFCSHLNFPHNLIPLDRLVCYASSSQLSQQIIKCIAMMRNNIIFKVFRLHRFLYYFLLLNDVSVFWVWKQKKINKFQVNTEFFTSILNPKHIDCNIRKMCKYLFILQSCVVCTYFLPHYFSSDSNYKPILYLLTGIKRHTNVTIYAKTRMLWFYYKNIGFTTFLASY